MTRRVVFGKKVEKAEEARLLQGLADGVKELEEFMASLSDTDLNNFKALINLPNAMETISKCPNERYRLMATLCYKLVRSHKGAPPMGEVTKGLCDLGT